MRRARRWLLVANAPVALLAAAATFSGLFGLAAPEPNPIRWFFVASPLLLALWLAVANNIFEDGYTTVSLAMLALPILLLGALLGTAMLAVR